MAGIPQTVPYPLPSAAELPANVVDWTPHPERAVLLVHDMQRYFLRPLDPGTDPRRGLVRNAVALRERCAALGVPVAHTGQPGMTDADRGLLRGFWGPGMTVAPEDRQIIDELAPAADDWWFTKWRYSAFFRSDLLGRMRDAGRDQLVLCGIYAHVGVLITAVEAFTHDIAPFLVADAVADFDAASHRMALEYAAARCAVVTTTERVTTALTEAAERAPELARSDR